jgi:hypothetical protein
LNFTNEGNWIALIESSDIPTALAIKDATIKILLRDVIFTGTDEVGWNAETRHRIVLLNRIFEDPKIFSLSATPNNASIEPTI